MKIDFHVHSSERSACGQAGEEAQIQAAIAAGLDAIAFTDHQKLIPKYRLSFLQQKYAPFRIFSGIEISLGEDFLVIGVNDRRLETNSWSYPELHTFVREQGGYIILAHPFRFHPALHEDIEQYPPDGIEIHSVNTPSSWEPRILEVAQKLSLTLFSNSDAHDISSIGRYYNEIPGFPSTDQELVSILIDGPVFIQSKPLHQPIEHPSWEME